MRVLQYFFLTLFQPLRVEQYIIDNPKKRKKITWIHVAIFLSLVVMDYLLFFILIYTDFDYDQSDLIYMGLVLNAFMSIPILLTVMISGAVFKKNSLFTFMISIYWNIITHLWFFPLFALSSELEDADVFFLVYLITMILTIFLLITNVYGKTRGITIVIIFPLILTLIAFLTWKGNSNLQLPSLYLLKQQDTGEIIILAHVRKPVIDIVSFIFPKYSYYYSFEFMPLSNSEKRFNKIYRYLDLDNFLENEEISSIMISGKNYSKFEFLLNNNIIPTNYKNVYDFLYKGSIYKLEYHINQSTELKVSISRKPKDNSQKSKYSLVSNQILNGTTPISINLLNHGQLIIQTDLSISLLNIQDGSVSWIYNNDDVYLNHFFSHNSKGIVYPSFTTNRSIFQNYIIALENIIYCTSPSGYLIAINQEKGEELFKTSLFVEEMSSLTGNLIFHLLFYTLFCSFLLLFSGLYRLPFFIVEAIAQFLVFITRKTKPDLLVKNYSWLPMFYDHVSTLPLPFSKKILQYIAKTDPQACTPIIGKLLDNGNHPHTTLSVFKDFHRNQKDYLFSYIKSSLENEKPSFLAIIGKKVKVDRNHIVNRLLFSYAALLDKPLNSSYIKNHIDILDTFVAQDYRHAKEIQLSYQFFYDSLQYSHLADITEADDALVEFMNISQTNLLHQRVINGFNIIIEIANDLQNFGMVDKYRDKQYFLGEARIKLFNLATLAEEQFNNPEKSIFNRLVEKWQQIITVESKSLRGPAELEITLLNKKLDSTETWTPIQAQIKNSGQSPADNIRVTLLENEFIEIKEPVKFIKVLGTGDFINHEFFIRVKGSHDEIRIYLDTQFNDFERKNKLRPFADIIKIASQSGQFRKIPNLYVVGTPLMSQKVFFGRKNALQFAKENLKGGIQNNVLIFYGQRRIGKSSILYRLKETSLKEEYLFTYIDCQGFADADTAKLLYQLCKQIYKNTKEQHIPLERPSLNSFKENGFLELDDYLDQLENVLDNKKMVLMFDEYEFLEYKVKSGSVSADIFDKLRNLMQHRNKYLAFIFVGTHRLTELTEDYWSFLFNTALYFEIGPLDRDESTRLITVPTNEYLRYDPLAIDKIIRTTGNHPYFIQVTCRLLINYCNKHEKSYATLLDINNILKEAVDGSTAHVKYLFQDCADKPEQEILTFLSRCTDESKSFASASEIIQVAKENNFKYDETHVKEMLSALKQKMLLQEDAGGSPGEFYGFTFEFLRIWIERHVKLKQGHLNLT
jgi:ATPase domain predominantly from Archaea